MGPSAGGAVPSEGPDLRMDTNFYDVVVCGGEVAGLVAASLLARRGFRVLVLGHEGERATFEAGGVTLSRAPALLPPLDEPPTARVLKELDCVALVKRRAPGIRPAFRVVLPGQQIDFPVEPAALTRELLRGFGPAAATVAAAIERLDAMGRIVDPLLASAITLPPSGFWERREVARFESLLPKRGHDPFAPLPAEHPFRTMAATPAAANASLIPHEIGPVTEARALALARQGQHVLEGGLAGLQELLLGRIETFGGDRRERLTPVAVVTRRGRAVGIRVQPRDETIGCHHLIWAGAPASLDQAMGAAAPPSRPLRIAGYRYAVALLAPAGVVAPGTPPSTFAVADPSRPLLEDNALAITVGQPGGRTGDRTPIWIECVVPASPVEGGASYLGALRGRVIHTLRRLIPSLADKPLLIASPHDGLPAEIPPSAGQAVPAGKAPVPARSPGATRSTPDGKAAGTATPTLPPPVYALAAPRPFDAMGIPHATGLKRLYLASRANLPGLGLEGDLVSGWGVAHLISGGQTRRHPGQRGRILG